ncbi:unnamed protein product, partial [Urochloa humidicola]
FDPEPSDRAVLVRSPTARSKPFFFPGSSSPPRSHQLPPPRRPRFRNPAATPAPLAPSPARRRPSRSCPRCRPSLPSPPAAGPRSCARPQLVRNLCQRRRRRILPPQQVYSLDPAAGSRARRRILPFAAAVRTRACRWPAFAACAIDDPCADSQDVVFRSRLVQIQDHKDAVQQYCGGAGAWHLHGWICRFGRTKFLTVIRQWLCVIRLPQGSLGSMQEAACLSSLAPSLAF